VGSGKGQTEFEEARDLFPFSEAATVFYDPLSATFDDLDHSQSEQRLITVGLSSRSRLLVVASTERGNSVRIISARLATKNERKKHEG
jgi:uncharacterized protein